MLPVARVTRVRGKGRRGYGHGPQPGQAVGIRGALRGLSDSLRATFGAGDVRADRQGAYGPGARPEGLERPARARTAPVPRHTGPVTDAIGDTPMGDESEVPGTAGCVESGGEHATCHCEQVSFLMGKYPKMGMDAIVQRLDRLDNARDGLEEDVAGILDDQSAAENHMEELRADQARYRENLGLALQKQQQVLDSLLHLVEDMSGRLRRLEELQPLASGPELPAKPAAAELVERVKTLRSATDKPMGIPAEAPYVPPRVDPGALPSVPMFSESQCSGNTRHRLGPCGKGT